VVVSPVGYIELRDSGAEFKRISSARDLAALVVAASFGIVAVRRLLG
jgi:hypothetical protein